MVHGRDRELRAIGAFATGLDPSTLVVSGPSGIGKSMTVLAALHGIGARASAVRVVRSCTARPYAQGLSGRRRLDLAASTARAGSAGAGPAGAGLAGASAAEADPDAEYQLDPVRLVDAVAAAFDDVGPGQRVLFVDDVELLTPRRAEWLQHLADVAYERDWRVIAATRHVDGPALPDDVELLDLGPLDAASLGRCLDAALHGPVAVDVADRLHWWSAGNPRVALELADGLSPAQLRGSAGWAGPDAVRSAARRAYRTLLDGLTPAEASDLADAATRLRAGGPVPVRHPLLALLCLERAGTPPAVERPAVSEPAGAEAVLDGLHLDDLPGVPPAGHAARAGARAVGVALLAGATWTGGGAWPPADADPAWTDHLWWQEAGPAGDAVRAADVGAAGARVAADLVALETAGIVPDPERLRADLGLIGATEGRHWVGTSLLVRASLLLGDAAEARRLLAEAGSPTGRSVAEVVARDVAEARVAMVEGRVADVRAHLAHATRLRPGVDDWLPVRGLRIAAAAMLDGRVPVSDTPPRGAPPSSRALGEFAADLGVAHLAVGQTERAAELLTIALERCSWPYRGRAHARADLVEAVVAAGRAHDGVPDRVRRLVEPPVTPQERAGADTAAAHARMHALLAGRDGARAGIDGWLPAPPMPVSLWERLRSLVAYARHCLAHGDRAASEPVVREARTLARLTGVPGWCVAPDPGPGSAGPSARAAWERLSDNEREIVRLALGGATNAQIAAAAYLSVRSVANRLRAIYALLGLRDRRDLVERAQDDPPGWLADSA